MQKLCIKITKNKKTKQFFYVRGFIILSSKKKEENKKKSLRVNLIIF